MCRDALARLSLFVPNLTELHSSQYSSAVITQMKERHASRPEMQWIEMDVLDLQYGEEEFDLVVDKGMWGLDGPVSRGVG